MKSEKLELLLNKVVEYNKLDGDHYKGFLYKNSGGYYIKVVETISGTQWHDGVKVNLEDGADEFITHAAKPTLMVVDRNSWHYKLLLYILGKKTPTPQTMQNGCPYWWLVVFSLLVCPFVGLYSVGKFIVMLLPNAFMTLLEKSIDNWVKTLDDVEAYEMSENQWTNRKDVQKLPITAKIFFDNNKDESFFNYFLSKKYGEDVLKDQTKVNEIHETWAKWREEVKIARQKRDAIEYQKSLEREKAAEIRMEARAAKKAIWDAKMKPYVDAKNKLAASIKEAFRFKGDVKALVKKTKQVVGLFITLVILVATFFVVEYSALALMVVIDVIVKIWIVFVYIAALLAVAGLIYVIGVFVGGWVQNLVNEYKKGKKIWYVEPFIYLVWYPVKYFFLALGYFALYVLGYPIKFVFYTVLWNAILVKLGKLAWKAMCAIGRGVVSSTGLLGEYIHADYTGLCPGLEWRGFDEEEQK
jgi:hypothetical protein